MIFYLLVVSPNKPGKFAQNQDGAGEEEEEEPVLAAQRGYSKHLAEDIHDEKLSDEDEEDDEDEAGAVVQPERAGTADDVDEVAHEATVRLEIACIEKVPELEQDEEGEEDAKFVGIQMGLVTREVEESVEIDAQHIAAQQVADLSDFVVPQQLPEAE